jgi:hypothetical protein
MGIFVTWANINPLFIHFENRFPGHLMEKYNIDIDEMISSAADE